MKRSSGNRPRKPNNRKKFRGSESRLEALEARMVMDAAAVYEAAQISFMGDDLEGKDGEFGKAGFDMALLYNQYISGEGRVSDPDGGVGPFVPGIAYDTYVISGDSIHLRLIGTSSTSQAVSALRSDLEQLGMEIVASEGALFTGWVRIDALDNLVSLANVGAIRASVKPVVESVGAANNQGDAAMGTDLGRTQFGVDGTGQKVGVISDSYNSIGGAAADVASGDLPGTGNPLGNVTPVQVLYDIAGASDEGRAMLQLVHDVAPGAELAFHSAGSDTLEFANAIRALAAAGSTVISDDVSFLYEPFFLDGLVAQAAEEVVANNIVYTTSAGNRARQSYEGNVVSSGNTLAAGSIAVDPNSPFSPAAFMGGTTIDFDPSAAVDDRQGFDLASGDAVRLIFQWDDLFAWDSGGAFSAATDVDFYLLNGAGQIVASSVYDNVGADPFEYIVYQNTSNASEALELMAVVRSGPTPTYMKYINFNSGFESMQNVEFASFSGTAVGHHNTENTLSVGAAWYLDTPAFGTDPTQLEYFSSYGGTPILFDAGGNSIAPVFRETVSLVAVDGVDTTFFGGSDPDNTGFENFFGTSAAAPNAAALAALIRQANPELVSTQVHQIMKDTAIDMDDPLTPAFDTGFDFATGYGLVDAVAAIQLAINTVGLNPGGGGGGGDGGEVTPPACGVYFGPDAVEVQAAFGANLFVTGHPMLDNGVANGQLGYDYEILDFLRGIGTFQEIPKAGYSIAVIGNSDADWGFSTGTKFAAGYESTTFYDIDNITPALWTQILSNDALIILSDITSVATGGLTDVQIDSIVDAKDMIAAAVNSHGLDVWTNAGSVATGYYDILPSGAVDVALLTPDATPYAPTTEGQAIGITSEMANAAEATVEFTSFDDDLHEFETRAATESVSLGAANVAFLNDEIVPISQAGSLMLNGVIGYKFNDANLDGIRQDDEAGLAGFTFFIDEDGDGRIGLCEPSAVTDASGKFVLYPRYSGTFNVLQVVEPGYYDTDDVQHVIEVNGRRISLNASLDSGAVVAVDYGDPGNPYAAHPVVEGFQLGESPLIDDGVVFGAGLKVGANVVSIASTSLYSPGILQAWMDFNKDGDFNDPGEQIFKNLTLLDGTHNYSFVIPSYVIDDSALGEFRIPLDVRFRVDYTLDLGPTGDAFAGEVEDYEVFISQDPEGGITLKDDTFTYQEDTAGQTFDVLANDKSFFNRAMTITDISDATPPAILSALSIVNNKIVLDATGIIDLPTDITFSYTVMDTKGFTETANVTLTTAYLNPAMAATPSFFNSSVRGDVNNDGFVTSHDLAIVLRELEYHGTRTLPQIGTPTAGFAKFIDANGDNSFDSLDVITLLDRMLQNQIVHPEEESIDAAFAEDEPASPAASFDAAPLALTLQTPIVTGLTSSTSSSTATNDVSPYIAGVFEKSNQQSDLPSQQSTSGVNQTETKTDTEIDEFLYSDNSFELQLIDSASSSTFMSEDVESTIDEIAIDVDAAWEEDLISS